MKGIRIAVSKTRIDTTEDVDDTFATLWLVPYVGFFPTKDAAEAAALARKNYEVIKPYRFSLMHEIKE